MPLDKDTKSHLRLSERKLTQQLLVCNGFSRRHSSQRSRDTTIALLPPVHFGGQGNFKIENTSKTINPVKPLKKVNRNKAHQKSATKGQAF